jgi:hypothetical protein
MDKRLAINDRAARVILGLVALSLILLAGVFFYFAAKQLARHGERNHRKNDMRQVGIGIHNYADMYGRWPSAVHRDAEGRPLASWRWLIYPLLEMGYAIETAERWDDPQNRWLLKMPHGIWSRGQDPTKHEDLHTKIVAITGPGTVFGADKPRVFGDFPTARTIVAIEVDRSGFYWPEPGDLPIDQITPEIIAGIDGDGVHVLFGSADVWFLSADTPVAELKKFCTIESAKKYDPVKVLGKYRVD